MLVPIDFCTYFLQELFLYLKNAVPREGGGQARYELKPADYFSVDFSSGDE